MTVFEYVPFDRLFGRINLPIFRLQREHAQLLPHLYLEQCLVLAVLVELDRHVLSYATLDFNLLANLLLSVEMMVDGQAIHLIAQVSCVEISFASSGLRIALKLMSLKCHLINPLRIMYFFGF